MNECANVPARGHVRVECCVGSLAFAVHRLLSLRSSAVILSRRFVARGYFLKRFERNYTAAAVGIREGGGGIDSDLLLYLRRPDGRRDDDTMDGGRLF